jgi:cytoskeletal protein RodZ
MSNVSSGVFATVKRLPPNTGRIATVVVIALILLAVIAWGIFELYKATSGTQTPETLPAQTVQTTPAPAEPAPKATDKRPETKAPTSKPTPKSKGLKSSGVEVPALYID